jgi:DNA helicase IV
LERGRAGQLRDIVATIQAEQDVIIRAPLDRAVIVQGGPGTGKTAVGLHRAAYLLYEHRRAVLEGGRVLVIGPNRLFLRYIAEVLPSLGETAVSQHTIETLAGVRYRRRGSEAATVAALKGDVRMAAVLRVALHQQGRLPSAPVPVRTSAGTTELSPELVARVVAECRATVSTYAAGRAVLRRRLETELLSRFVDLGTGAGPDEEEFGGRLRRDGAFDRLVGQLWPTLSAPALVRRVLGSPSARRRAARDVLSDAEVALLARPAAAKVDDEPWTAADLPLLDEAEWLINGVPARYLHVVVDEAQDLSPMALRMVARRAPSGSLTVLGDLAQATAPAAARDWHTVAELLGVGTAVDHRLLEVGYRLPGEILDWASALLPEAAPAVGPTRSARRTGRPPRIVAVAGDLAAVAAATVDAVAGLAAAWGLIGVVAPEGWARAVREALVDSPLAAEVGPADPQRIDHQITVVGPAAAKGLEFDAVVVVEPAEIVAEAGVRALYVALTRCVQELAVVHAAPLPAALVQASWTAGSPEVR